LYIPACPLTERNAEYLSRQRDTFLRGTPGPDFPGGKGESEHVGRITQEILKETSTPMALQAMGLESFKDLGEESSEGERKVIEKANEILGFRS
jgi:hypothetical protein